MRYYATALSLKAASSTAFSRRLYRTLGNIRNAHTAASTQIPEKYFRRSDKYLEILRDHSVLRPGLEVLEIGTGWVHWEALLLRLEVPTSSLLYDVWDNRSWERFRAFVGQLADPKIRQSLGVTNPYAGALIRAVMSARTMEETYRLLDFEYVADEDGLLGQIAPESRDLVISSDVGEHLHRDDIEQIIARTYDVLRSGGWAYHQIVLADHLRIYAPDAHPKEYLKYSRTSFDRYLNNRVQYINCVQIPEWVQIFDKYGFEIVEERKVGTCDTSDIAIDPDYSGIEKDDLDCTVVQFLLRKP